MTAGDGTTTLNSIGSVYNIAEGLSGCCWHGLQWILSGIDKAVIAAVEELKNLSVRISDTKAIAFKLVLSLRTLIRQLVTSLLKRNGKSRSRDGVITVEEGRKLYKTGLKVDVVEGMQFIHGYLSCFINNQRRTLCWSQAHSFFLSTRKCL